MQGLSATKFPAILRWLREKATHGAILTETHLTTDPAGLLTSQVTAGGGTIWPGMQIFYVPGTGFTEGIAIVLGPGLHLSSPQKYVHPQLNYAPGHTGLVGPNTRLTGGPELGVDLYQDRALRNLLPQPAKNR
jgi:hypothetical protein